MMLRRIPFGSRSGLSDPKGVGTPLPDSKVTGDPSATMIASIPQQAPRGVAATPSFVPKYDGAFARTFDQVDPILLGGDTDRRRARLVTEHEDRTARFKEGVNAKPGGAWKPNGWDWINRGRVENPWLPGGERGIIAVTRAPAQRGVTALQTQVPISTVETLAEEGRKADTVGVGRAVPVGLEPVSTAPDRPVTDLDAEKQKKNALGMKSEAGSIVYALIALAVVFLVIKG